jgi:signal transduction histidine kinase/DNA-binding response OmpR family regulator
MWSALAGAAKAAPPRGVVTLRDAVSYDGGGGALAFLEDPTHALSIEEVAAPGNAGRFMVSQSAAPNFGFTTSTYWFRLPLRNESREQSFLLELGYPHLDRVELYSVDADGTTRVQRGGDSLPFSERALEHHSVNFAVELPSGAEQTLYLKVDTEGSLQLPLKLWTMKGFTEAKLREYAELFLYYGIIAVMILYNVFLFFTIRDPNYLIYVWYLVSWGLYQLSLNGLSYQYLWPDSPVIANRCIAPLGLMANIALAIFARRFLQTRSNAPTMHRLLTLQLAVAVTVLPVSLIVGTRPGIMLMAATSMVAALLTLSAGVICLLRGYRPARFFVLAFVALLIGVIMVVLRVYGVLGGAALAIDTMQIGSAIEVILLSLALGDRIKSEQLTYQRRIEKLNADLIEKERARTAFFQNTSHELRTPLNGILAFVDLLSRGEYGQMGDRARTQLGKVSNLARSLLMQVNAILDLAKSRSGQLALTNTAFPVTELLDEARVVAEGLTVKDKGRGFAIELGAGLDRSALFVADREKLATILRNLVGNAFKFTDPARFNQVRLSVEITPRRELVLRVADTGIGIDKAHHAAVFEEFKQVGDSSARRVHEGTGLGLALVQRLAELMGGRVELDSTPGQGSTFTVVVPEQRTQTIVQVDPPAFQSTRVQTAIVSLPPPPARSFVQDAANRPHSGKGPRVLVCDDNEINCEVVRDVLGAQGYRVEHVLRGSDALASMQARPPDLLLLDLMMPETSGEDVLQSMRASGLLKDVPVIVLTARASEEDRVRALQLGADDYLAKPILGDELVLRVHNTLARIGLSQAVAERRAIEDSLAAAQKVRAAVARESATVPGVTLSDHYESAERTGGDWLSVSYDPGKRRLFVLIGDVTGHGMASALITLAAAGAAKGCLSAMRDSGVVPERSHALHVLCAAVNQAVCEAGESSRRTMTMAFVCIDLDSGAGTYLNAGHTEVYLAQAQGISVLLEPGAALGASATPVAGEREFVLCADDTLFLHTDGLVENSGPGGQTVARRALLRLLKSNRDPEQLKESLLAHCRDVWGDRPPDDDCAFLALRLTRLAAAAKAS